MLPLARVPSGRFDPVPQLPPAALFAVPTGTLLAVAAGVVVVAVVVGWAADALAARQPRGQVMRGGD